MGCLYRSVLAADGIAPLYGERLEAHVHEAMTSENLTKGLIHPSNILPRHALISNHLINIMNHPKMFSKEDIAFLNRYYAYEEAVDQLLDKKPSLVGYMKTSSGKTVSFQKVLDDHEASHAGPAKLVKGGKEFPQRKAPKEQLPQGQEPPTHDND